MDIKSFNHDFTYERVIKNTISRKILYNRYRSFKDADKQEQHYFRNVKIDIIEENKRIRFKHSSMGIYEYCWRNLKGYRRNKMYFINFSDLKKYIYKPFFNKRM